MHIQLLLFEEFETLDLFGPLEVLARSPGHRPDCYSLDGGDIVSAQGTSIATQPFSEILPDGVLLLPGGRGTRHLAGDTRFLTALRMLCTNARYCLSVCTGSALLASAGVLDGRRATSNKKAFGWVESCSNQVLWQKCARWVRDGKYYTASGVSAGIDMALGFTADLYGRESAERLARDIEYLWNSDPENDPFAI